MVEEWMDIKNYEGLYQISNIGRVKSLERFVQCSGNGKRLIKENIMKGSINNHGYNIIYLSRKQKFQTKSIQRLVALHFIPNPENKPQVNHINGIKTDNNVDNLEWNTASENLLHALKIGLKVTKKGGDSPVAREVINTKTLEIYGCVKDACINTIYSYSYFYNMLSGKNINKTDFIFLKPNVSK